MRNYLNQVWSFFLIVLFVFVALGNTLAQSNVDNPNLLTIDAIDKIYDLSNHFKIFKATEEDYKIAEIAHPSFDSNFGSNYPLEEGYTYWGKIIVKNELSSLNATTHWILELAWETEFAEIYTQNESGIISAVKKTGNIMPRSEKSDLYFSSIFNSSKVQLNFPLSEEITIYLKLIDLPGRFKPSFNCTLSSLQPATINTQSYRFGFLCLFFGMVIIMAIYSFILYFFIKDKTYLFYALYLVSILFYNFYSFGFVKTQLTWIFPNNLVMTHSFATISYWIVIFYVSFISSFLNLKKILPFWYKVFRVIIVAGMVLFVLDNILLYFNNYSDSLSFLINAGYLLVLLLTTPIFFYQLYQTKLPRGNFIILGGSAMLLGAASLLPPLISGIFDVEELFKLQAGIIVEIIIFSLGLSYHQRKKEREAQKNLEREKEHLELQQLSSENEALLLNILPVDVATELKRDGKAKARYYENLTVLFTDFADFTSFTEKATPTVLVQELDFIFSSFDEIIHRYGIEKIKTIGDAYLCTGGISTPHSQINEVIQAALDIRDFIENYKKTAKAKGHPSMDIRLGIHTGAAIGGVVGNNKFAFDIWGDTVNIASRMETHGMVGKINVSQAIRDNASNTLFNFEARGKMEVKNKGFVEMYFVERL